MGVTRSSWDMLGTRFRCRRAPTDVHVHLAALLDRFGNSDGKVERAVDFEIVERNGALCLEFGENSRGRGPIKLKSPAGPWAEYHMISEALGLARDHWVLHAGGVVAPRGTCVILGKKDAGKTSLTLFLWAQGMHVICDDVLPMRHGTRSAEVFPRSFHFGDDVYSTDLLARIPPRPASFPAANYPFPGPTDIDVPPVVTVLALEPGGPAEGELIPMTQSETAHRLVRGAIRVGGFDFDRVLKSAVVVSNGCAGYRLRASTPEGAASTAFQLLTG